MKEINLTEWIIYTEIFSEKKSCSGLPIPSGLNPISTRVALIIATQARIYFLQTSKQQYGSKQKKLKEKERWWAATSLKIFWSSMTILEIVPQGVVEGLLEEEKKEKTA